MVYAIGRQWPLANPLVAVSLSNKTKRPSDQIDWGRVIQELASVLRARFASSPLAVMGFSVAASLADQLTATLARQGFGPSFTIIVDGQPFGKLECGTRHLYPVLIAQIREAVQSSVPSGATLIVATKGDPELTRFPERTGWHFPQDSDGTYAGYYPEDSATAIEHLEGLRRKGGDFLLFPANALWWLGHYKGLRHYLDETARLIFHESGKCAIFSLNGPWGRTVENSLRPADDGTVAKESITNITSRKPMVLVKMATFPGLSADHRRLVETWRASGYTVRGEIELETSSHIESIEGEWVESWLPSVCDVSAE